MSFMGSAIRGKDKQEDHPTALHLRAMNMLFEGLKERGAMLIVPSSAVDTMNLGGLAGLAAYTDNVLPRDLRAEDRGEQPPEMRSAIHLGSRRQSRATIAGALGAVQV